MSIRNLRWAGLLVCALVIALAVGGTFVARGAPGAQDNPPLPAPNVFDTIPLPGEELALDGPVSFFFDLPMDTDSVEAAFAVVPEVAGDLAWTNGDRTLTFAPTEDYTRATEYTFGFSTDALSAEGVALEEAFTLRLTTVGYLEIAEVLPGDGTSAVDTDTVFTVIFNRPVVPLVTVEEMDTLPKPLSFEPDIEGAGEWLNTSIYLFTPTSELRGGTEYTATVAAGLTDVTGGVLEADYEWKFSTLQPDVLEISPGTGWDRIPLARTVRIVFSQAMDPEPTEAAIRVEWEGPMVLDEDEPFPEPAVISGTFEWSEDFRSVTFTPDELLKLESYYAIYVDQEIARSATGATLREGASSGFSTMPYPKITGTRPVDGDDFASPYGGFTIYFNTNMDLDTLKDKVIVEPEPWREFDDYYYDYSDNYTLAFDTEPSTEYTITILPGMADEYGNTIDEGLTVNYTTGPYPPELTIQATGSVGMYSAANPETRVFVTHRNVGRIDLGLWRVSTARLADLTGSDSYSAWRNFTPRPADLLRQWSIDVTAAQDLRRYELLLISDEGPSGIANVQCLGAPDPRVKVGDVVIVTRDDLTPLNIRQEPNLGGTEITEVLPDDTMQVIGGPYCADGYLWWQVRLDNDITGWAAEGSFGTYFYEPLGAAPLDPNVPNSDVFGAPYNPDALDPGVYYLEVSSPQTDNYDRRPRRHVLLVQSANITLKFSQDTALAWVTDMDNGEPVADVPVIFYNSDFNPVATANTDADGMAVVEIPHLSDLYSTMYATVDRDQHFGFAVSQWADGMDPWQFDIRSDYEPENFTVYLYTDRPIYRPGQPVYFKGILRDRFDVQYSVPQIRTVPVQVYDDRGEIIFEQDIEVTPGGSFSGEVMLADDAPLGYYRVVAGVESNKRSSFGISFNVAEYRAPEFQVDVTPELAEVAQGDTIRVLVDSTYFFGGAVSNADVSYTVLSNDYYFRYTGDEPGYFSFVDNNYDFYGPEYYGPYGGPVAEGEGKTDSQGRFWIELDADLGDDVESKSWTIEARVVDESDQLVAGRTSVTVHQGLVYVGLQPEEYIGRAERENLVNLIAVDWFSDPVPGQEVAYEVVERRWFSVQEEDDFGRTNWSWEVKEEPVEGGSGTVTVDERGLAQISFTPPVGGVYKVYARTTDERGNQVQSSTFLWVSGRNFINWRQENNNRIQLITDKDEYSVGDTAQILIPSPWQGDAYALITLERGDILTHEVMKLTTNSTVYELPVEDFHSPNVFFSVVLVKGVDEHNPTAQFRMGVVQLDVDTSHYVMDIEVESNVDVAAGEFAGPGDEVEFTVTATNWEGTPVPNAEVGVGVTDLAVLSIAASNSSELLPFFYSQRGITVRTSSPLTISVDQATQTIIDTIKGGGGGYGDGGIFEVRQEFVDTPLWEPSVFTDENGAATVKVTLPDNLTTWRLDARAVTDGSDGPMLVGQTTFDLLSTKPVLVRPGTPRFFIAGDIATVSAIVNNNSNDDLLTSVTLEGTGFRFADGVEATQWVQIASKGRARVNWQFEVLDVEEIDLTFFANAGDGAYTDATKPTFLQGDPLPVYKYEVPETVGTAGTLYGPEAGSRTEVIALPQRFDVTQGELTVNLDRSLAAATVDGMSWLRNYPHYCVEQIVSRFLPNAVTLNAMKRLDVEDPVLQAHLEVEVGYALQRLYAQQKVDGGWGWFPRDQSNPIVTAYALIGLVEAQRAGFTVNQDVINKAAGFVEDSLYTVKAQDSLWRVNRQAFLLYALARSERGNMQRTARLFEERERMSLYAKAYLAMTFNILDPDDSRAMELINDLNTALVVSATGAHWEETYYDWWNWNTNTRTTALGLLAMTKIDPENQLIPNVVRWLMVARNADHWETTQETAWAVMGLAEWMVITNELHPDYTFGVTLNNERLALDDNTATPDNVQETERLVIQVADLLGDEANRMVISRSEGEGNLYYTAHLRAFLPVPEVEALNRGIIIDRKYSLLDDPDGNPITGAEVGQPVQVTLTIIAPNNLHYVVIEDPLPAGADAVNPNLQTSSVVGTQPSLARDSSFRRGWGWWYFSNTEFRDEKVVLYATYLRRGTYQFNYVIYPGLAGVYNVIPPTGQEFYFPEVYGRGEGTLFTITGGSASETVDPPSAEDADSTESDAADQSDDAEESGDESDSDDADADTSVTSYNPGDMLAGDVLATDPQFSTLYDLLVETDTLFLLEVGEGTTVLAPTNDAFKNMAEGALAALSDDPALLAETLAYHMITDPVYIGSDEFIPGTVLHTLADDIIGVTEDSRGLQFNQYVRIVQPDIATQDHMIHAIDAVLLPQLVTLSHLAGPVTAANQLHFHYPPGWSFIEYDTEILLSNADLSGAAANLADGDFVVNILTPAQTRDLAGESPLERLEALIADAEEADSDESGTTYGSPTTTILAHQQGAVVNFSQQGAGLNGQVLAVRDRSGDVILMVAGKIGAQPTHEEEAVFYDIAHSLDFNPRGLKDVFAVAVNKYTYWETLELLLTFQPDVQAAMEAGEPYTIFLPVDELVYAQYEADADLFDMLYEEEGFGATVAGLHVVEGIVTPADIFPGAVFTTINSDLLRVDASEIDGAETWVITGPGGSAALADFTGPGKWQFAPAMNGYVHVIDAMLLPPSVTATVVDEPQEPAEPLQPADPLPLTEEFVLPAAGLVVHYPEGWIAREGENDGGIEIANSAEALDTLDGGDPLASGQVAFLALLVASMSDLGVTDFDDVIDLIVGNLRGDGGPSIGDPRTLEMQGYNVVVFPLLDESSHTEGVFALWEQDGYVLLAIGAAYQGEFAAVEPMLLAMVQAVEFDAEMLAAYESDQSTTEEPVEVEPEDIGSDSEPDTAPVEAARYATEFGITFLHPGDWYVLEDAAQGIVQAVTREEAVSDAGFESGDMGLIIFDPAFMNQLGASTPEELLDTFIAILASNESTITFGEITEHPVGDVSLTYAPIFEGTSEGAALAFTTGEGDDLMLVFLLAYEGEYVAAEPFLLDIVQSITYDAP